MALCRMPGKRCCSEFSVWDYQFLLILFLAFDYSEYSGGISNLDTSAMAKISDGYTIGAIDACLREVMTCKRKLQLRSQPLTNAELINVLW